MCTITATEFKQNLSKYMHLSLKEDVVVTLNGEILTMLTNPKKKAIENFLALAGSVPNYDYEKALDERDSKRWKY